MKKTVSLLILGLFVAVFSYSPVSAENIQDQSSLNLRNEGRSPNFGYDNVGFRIIREK